jgi:hypothetical protein
MALDSALVHCVSLSGLGFSPDVENTLDGSVRSETNKVDNNTPEYSNPHGEEGSSGSHVDSGPDVGER